MLKAALFRIKELDESKKRNRKSTFLILGGDLIGHSFMGSTFHEYEDNLYLRDMVAREIKEPNFKDLPDFKF
jgi:hypothetical protein